MNTGGEAGLHRVRGLLTIAAVAVLPALAPASFTVGAPTIEAEVVRSEPDHVVVKDVTGKERRFHVDKTTRTFEKVKAGDVVEVGVQPDGHTQIMMIVSSKPQ